MLLTNKINSAILQLQSRERTLVDYLREVIKMIYEELNELDGRENCDGVSPLSYVVLDCGK